jgi:catechol 2,3-dioxygenase-like lactoylglutathione lyase family enzyme
MPAIPARISLITLGVADVGRSTAFYEALDWRRSSSSEDGVISFFHTSGAVLDLFETGDLAEDIDLPREAAEAVSVSFRGVALAINVDSRDAVDDAFAAADAAGARIVKPPRAAEWGGYSGYFADPDGHLWEVAHNPGWPLDDRGLPQLP